MKRVCVWRQLNLIAAAMQPAHVHVADHGVFRCWAHGAGQKNEWTSHLLRLDLAAHSTSPPGIALAPAAQTSQLTHNRVHGLTPAWLGPRSRGRRVSVYALYCRDVLHLIWWVFGRLSSYSTLPQLSNRISSMLATAISRAFALHMIQRHNFSMHQHAVSMINICSASHPVIMDVLDAVCWKCVSAVPSVGGAWMLA